MASLTQTAKQVRLMVNVVLVCILLFIGYRITAKIIEKLTAKPPEAVKPDFALGKLSYPKFNTVTIDENATYDLDLIAASLPTVPNIVPVYKKVPYTIGLLSPERAKEIAKNFGFDPEQFAEITPTLYKWTDLNLPRTMTIDLKTRNFEVSYDYQKDTSVFGVTAFRSKQDANTKAIQILNKAQSLPSDISSGKQITTLMTWKNSTLTEAGTYDVANSAQVYLQRQNIQVIDFAKKEYSYPVIGSTPDQGPIYLLISSSPEKNKDILNLKFNYYTVNQKESGTYYLKTAEKAWQELQNGEGYPVYFDAPAESTYSEIDIKEVYLAYYDQSEKQDFLEPIWVFKGETVLANKQKANFVSYIPAITSEWLEVSGAIPNEEIPQ